MRKHIVVSIATLVGTLFTSGESRSQTCNNTTQCTAIAQSGSGNALSATATSGEAILATSTSNSAVAIKGTTTGTGSTGVKGVVSSTSAIGVAGANSVSSGLAYGVNGAAQSPGGYGVYGTNSTTTQPAAQDGTGSGVFGSTTAPGGAGVFGTGIAVGGIGVWGKTNGNIGVYGTSPATTGAGTGVAGATGSNGGIGGIFENFGTGTVVNNGTGSGSGVVGETSVTGGAGVYGYTLSNNGMGVYGAVQTADGTGVMGVNVSQSGGPAYGIFGQSQSSDIHAVGVYGQGTTGLQGNGVETGVYASCSNSDCNGAYFQGNYAGVTGKGNTGVVGTGVATGVYGVCSGSGCNAGYFQGNVNVTGALTCGSGCNSDQRLKQNIKPLTGAVDKLLQLKGVTFEWKSPEEHQNHRGAQTGVIAQDVEKVFPQWVRETDKGVLNVDPDARTMVALTVEGFREMKAENDALRQRVQWLEAGRRPMISGMGEGGIGLGLLAMAGAVFARRRRTEASSS